MTTRAPSSRDDHLLAAEYVLGVLPAAERATFAQRLAREPELAGHVRHWEEHFAHLTNGIESIQPPPQIVRKLEERLLGSSKISKTPDSAGLWNSLHFWRGLAAAALVGVVVLGGLVVRESMAPSGSESLVAEVRGDGNLVKLVALYDGANGELRLNRVEGAAQQGRSFELWLISGQDAPVSLGVLPDATTTRVVLPEALRAKAASAILAVSDEPAGGSPTGAPTGTVLATGVLTAI